MKKDFFWNTLGSIAYAASFPLLTIIITYMQGEELAGMFSVAFVTAQMFMIVGNYAVRAFQVTDIDNGYPLADYQGQRFITCVLMFFLNLIYSLWRGYNGELLLISIVACLYKLIDALADVYEGELQRKGHLFVAGKALFYRVIISITVFIFMLHFTRNLLISLIIMTVVSVFIFMVTTLRPVARMSSMNLNCSLHNVKQLFIQCFPLFLSLFLLGYVTNSPKYALEDVMEYRYQTYFNALYFPSQIIYMLTGFVFKPMLVTMAEYWNGNKKMQLVSLVKKVFVIVFALTGLGMGAVYLLGIPILSFVFGVNLSGYQWHAACMIAAGGVTAIINFLYYVLTVMRKQRSLMITYVLAFVLSLVLPSLFVAKWEIWGACLSYLVVVSGLAIMLFCILEKAMRKA